MRRHLSRAGRRALVARKPLKKKDGPAVSRNVVRALGGNSFPQELFLSGLICSDQPATSAARIAATGGRRGDISRRSASLTGPVLADLGINQSAPGAATLRTRAA